MTLMMRDVVLGQIQPYLELLSMITFYLYVGAYTDMPAYVEVIDEETGEVVVEEEFEGETEISIEDAGSYTVQIYSGNTVMTGEFEVE